MKNLYNHKTASNGKYYMAQSFIIKVWPTRSFVVFFVQPKVVFIVVQAL